MEWIKCSDRMPSINSIDLICYDENELHFGSFICSYGSILEEGEKVGFKQEIYSYGEIMGEKFVRVTHWIPFPEPPK